jgi:hypothetical protein
MVILSEVAACCFLGPAVRSHGHEVEESLFDFTELSAPFAAFRSATYNFPFRLPSNFRLCSIPVAPCERREQ